MGGWSHRLLRQEEVVATVRLRPGGPESEGLGRESDERRTAVRLNSARFLGRRPTQNTAQPGQRATQVQRDQSAAETKTRHRLGELTLELRPALPVRTIPVRPILIPHLAKHLVPLLLRRSTVFSGLRDVGELHAR
jgi:hypothetical protein